MSGASDSTRALAIRSGRFIYRLRVHANAALPATNCSETPLATGGEAQAPQELGDGFPLVLIARPPDGASRTQDSTAAGPHAPDSAPVDELPRERVRLALLWLAPDPREESRRAAAGPVIEAAETMLADGQAVSSAIEGLGGLATKHGLQIQACVIELAAGGVGEAGGLDDETLERILPKRFHAALAEERAREASLAYVQVCTAGLPPLVHVHSGGIIFPVRSWVPAGLYPDWQPLCQSIECEAGDRLIVHTELTAPAASLKAFHQSLQSDDVAAGDWSLFEPDPAAENAGRGLLATRAALELSIEAPVDLAGEEPS